MNAPGEFDHASLQTAISTFVGYGVILVVMTIALFVIPFLIFLVL